MSLLRSCLSLVLVGCVGCGSADTQDGAGGGAQGTGGSGGAGGSREAAGGGGSGGAAGGGGVASGGGGASFNGDYDGSLQFIRDASSRQVFAGALFGSLGSAKDCTTSHVGGCMVSDCASGLSMASPKTAGTLTLSGGIFGGGVALPPLSDGAYGDELAQQEISFHAGDTLKVVAGGAEVPAFSESINAPSCATLTAPALSSMLAIDTTHDLELSWSGGHASETFFVEIFGVVPSTQHSTGVSCEFAATEGHGTVPAATMSKLAGTTSGALGYGEASLLDFAAGNERILLVAACEGSNSATFGP